MPPIMSLARPMLMLVLLAACGRSIAAERSPSPHAEVALYESPVHRFRVRFPIAPESFERDGTTIYRTQTGDLHCLINVVVNRLVGDESYEIQHLRFDKARDKILPGLEGTLVEDLNIRLADRYEGRMLRVVCSDEEIYRIRMYCVGDHFYQVWVGGPKAAVDGSEANAFLGSFLASRQLGPR